MTAPTIPLSSSSETIATTQYNKVVQNCSRQDIIVELTARLSQKEAELRASNKAKADLEKQFRNQPGRETEKAYESLLAHLGEREEEFRFISMKNDTLSRHQKELERACHQLQHTAELQGTMLEEQEENISKMEKNAAQRERLVSIDMERMRSQLGHAIEAQRIALEEKNEKIEQLTKSQNTVKNLRIEIDQYKEKQDESEAALAEQALTLTEKDAKICDLESKVLELSKEIKNIKTQQNEEQRKAESKETMLNLQREENEQLLVRIENLEVDISEQSKLINIFKTKFECQDVDIPALMDRCHEAEIMWARIEERTKKFDAKESVIGLLREENNNLLTQEKHLRSEISELKHICETVQVQFSGENVDMAYFTSQLRNSIQLKNKIEQLEELIQGKGFTKVMVEAENKLRQKERQMASDIDKINEIFEMLKPQVCKEEIEVPRLIGLLEESLALFSDDKGIDNVSTKATDDDDEEDYSVNTNNSTDNIPSTNSYSCSTFKCTSSKPEGPVIDFLQDIKFGLLSIHNEGLCLGGSTSPDAENACWLHSVNEEKEEEQ